MPRNPDKPDSADHLAAQAKYAGGVHPTSADVDYSLWRDALLREVRAGKVGTYEVCDASPYLLSATRFHGEETTQHCPICRREHLWLVHYIFGDELRSSAGQARTRAELAMLARGYRRFDVYVVEVCRGCGWNHLVNRYILGRDHPTPPATTGVPTPSSIHDRPRPRPTGTTKR